MLKIIGFDHHDRSIWLLFTAVYPYLCKYLPVLGIHDTSIALWAELFPIESLKPHDLKVREITRREHNIAHINIKTNVKINYCPPIFGKSEP